MRRRRLLSASLGLLVVAGAGCTDDGSDGGDGTSDDSTDAGPTDDGSTDDGPSPTDTATSSTGTDSTGDDLDLREANVTGVEIGEHDGSEYRFAVTLLHDDDGEDGYADWWQVETLDGNRLGRRDLAHAHGTREFTRSATIAVPDDVDCVVVRGHDRTHEYGGQAAVVHPDSGAVNPVRPGSERAAFDAGDCPG